MKLKLPALNPSTLMTCCYSYYAWLIFQTLAALHFFLTFLSSTQVQLWLDGKSIKISSMNDFKSRLHHWVFLLYLKLKCLNGNVSSLLDQHGVCEQRKEGGVDGGYPFSLFVVLAGWCVHVRTPLKVEFCFFIILQSLFLSKFVFESEM